MKRLTLLMSSLLIVSGCNQQLRQERYWFNIGFDSTSYYEIRGDICMPFLSACWQSMQERCKNSEQFKAWEFAFDAGRTAATTPVLMPVDQEKVATSAYKVAEARWPDRMKYWRLDEFDEVMGDVPYGRLGIDTAGRAELVRPIRDSIAADWERARKEFIAQWHGGGCERYRKTCWKRYLVDRKFRD